MGGPGLGGRGRLTRVVNYSSQSTTHDVGRAEHLHTGPARVTELEKRVQSHCPRDGKLKPGEWLSALRGKRARRTRLPLPPSLPPPFLPPFPTFSARCRPRCRRLQSQDPAKGLGR